MKDDFKATFVVDLSPEEAWHAMTRPVLGNAKAEANQCVLPGFPGRGDHGEGALCTEIEVDPGRLLRVRKEHEPCAGTEIAIVLEAIDSGTRVSIVQSGFGDFMKQVWDVVQAHGRQIVNDFRLHLERGIIVPGTVWGPSLGAMTKQTGSGLELGNVQPDGFSARAGMTKGDLLLTLRGVRIHNTEQLWTVLALSSAGDEIEASWARGREEMQATACL
ncbi:MAG: PDZ domain-containing protein [Gammaproteobacteria bacterium]